MTQRKKTLTMHSLHLNSLLRILPSPHLPDFPGSLLRRLSPHHLPGRHRRLAPNRPTPVHILHHRRCPHHRSFLAPKLEYLPRNERGEEKVSRKRTSGIRQRRLRSLDVS